VAAEGQYFKSKCILMLSEWSYKLYRLHN
jgi:hypothetical protein